MTKSADITGALGGGIAFVNRLINGGFQVFQRGGSSFADDAYCLDRWYVLTETGNVTVAQTTDPEVGTINGIQLTQPDASPKRIGLAQIVPSELCRDLRSALLTLAGRVKCSSSQAIRYAILESTATADIVTSDVVSNWASGSYTPGAFFISGVNVLAVGSLTPSANTWAALTALSGSPSSGANNLVVVLWSESTLAQNATLEFSRLQLQSGGAGSLFDRRPATLERLLCRAYWKTGSYYVPATAAPATIEHNPPMAGQSNPAISGGGAGFAASTNTRTTAIISQTTGATQTLVFDNEL